MKSLILKDSTLLVVKGTISLRNNCNILKCDPHSETVWQLIRSDISRCDSIQDGYLSDTGTDTYSIEMATWGRDWKGFLCLLFHSSQMGKNLLRPSIQVYTTLSSLI
jgi:hypothetical protein